MSCRNCHSTNTWDDIAAWGCNDCNWCSIPMLDKSGKSERDYEAKQDELYQDRMKKELGL